MVDVEQFQGYLSSMEVMELSSLVASLAVVGVAPQGDCLLPKTGTQSLYLYLEISVRI
jgi:hypothetical protein